MEGGTGGWGPLATSENIGRKLGRCRAHNQSYLVPGFPLENGQVFFFEDIYGYDKALAKLFAQAYASKN
jgi:hypothetical protein